jgi:hypothetical protein
MEDIIVSDVVVPEVSSLSVEQVQDMIHACSLTEDGESLRGAMTELKSALKANPVACAMLLPEDIGQMTTCLRKMTNREILADLTSGGTRKKESKSKVVVTQEQIDNLSAEDLL